MDAYLRTLLAAPFYAVLYAREQQIAAAFRAAGCRHCSGKLDNASYERRPRGVRLPRELRRRLSFTCRRCKRRATPPSLLYLGRKVYVGAWVLLTVAMTQGARRWSVRRVCRTLGIDRRTFTRWRGFWRKVVPASLFWRRARGSFMPPVRPRHLPLGMIERFTGGSLLRIRRTLSFLAPLTTTTPLPSHAR